MAVAIHDVRQRDQVSGNVKRAEVLTKEQAKTVAEKVRHLLGDELLDRAGQYGIDFHGSIAFGPIARRSSRLVRPRSSRSSTWRASCTSRSTASVTSRAHASTKSGPTSCDV